MESAKLQDERILYLLNSLSQETKSKLLRSLEKQNSPPFILLPRIFFTSNSNERKCFKYSLAQDKYLPCESKIPETYDKLFPIGIDKYLYREEEKEGERKFYLVEGRKKKLVLSGVETLYTIQNGNYFVVYQGDETDWQLLDSNFEPVKAFEPESYYVTSSERYLVLERFGESLIIYDMKTDETITVEMNQDVSSALLSGDLLVIGFTGVPPYYVMTVDISKIDRNPSKPQLLQHLGEAILNTEKPVYVQKVSKDLILSHETSEPNILGRLEGEALFKVQEIKKFSTPSRVCDNLFIFPTSHELWRVKEVRGDAKAFLFAEFVLQEYFPEYLYPTPQDIREVSGTLEIPVPNEVRDLIVSFCAELIDPDK